MSKKVRIMDIAERLGLSSTLVSLVLNNKANQHGIKAQTQEKVIAMAHSMGYFESGDASYKDESIVFSPGIVGMIVSSLKDPFVIEISEYLRRAFADIGFGFSIFTLDRKDERYAKFVSGIKRMFSGVILTGDSAYDEIIRSLKSSDYPFLLLEKSGINLRLNEVLSDCDAGAEKLVAHLSKFRYRKFTIVRSPGNSIYNDEKLKCFKTRLKKDIDESEINECAIEIDIVGKNIDAQLLPFTRRPLSTDVLVISEAALVYPVLESLVRLKIRVPVDLGLVSLEYDPAFKHLAVPVTCLERDIPAMSSKIVATLWSEIKNRGKSKYKRTVKIVPGLLIGRSCGSL